jgi:hypothetical protein
VFGAETEEILIVGRTHFRKTSRFLVPRGPVSDRSQILSAEKKHLEGYEYVGSFLTISTL